MYGIYHNENSGLALLNKAGHIFIPEFSSWANFSPAYSAGRVEKANARSSLYFAYAPSAFPYIIAYENGILYKNGYFNDGASGIGHHTQIYHCFDRNDFQKLYFFIQYDGVSKFSFPEYGTALWDENGQNIYHSNLKSMKVLGHVSKYNQSPVWYFADNRHIGKKYAFIQIGSDFVTLESGWDGHHETSQDGTVIRQEGSGVKIFTQQELFYDAYAKWPARGNKNNNMMWVIIDVTDLQED